MLLLPVLYLALIVAVVYGVWYYAVHSPSVLFASRVSLLTGVMYVAPIFAGATGVLFMIKPIFAPPPKPPPATTLLPEEQPLLHGFVERLCRALGAPVPREIRVDMQVNASASFRRGMRSLLGSDLVLTLGLPFVTGLNVTQLSGILAHEFGHFSQAVAMRFSFLIGSVNHWFVRVVYQRDEWDEKLEQARREASTGYVNGILQLATFFVWLSRRVLWLLMYVGHVMSAYLSRQMEYNADRHQVQVVGSAGFRPTYLRMGLLDFAGQAAEGQVNEMMAESRLVDDYPTLTRIHAERLDTIEEARSQIVQGMLEGRAKLFDTHPSGADRVRRAERRPVPARMHCLEPARHLFRNFDGLSAGATSRLYEMQLGEALASFTMVSTEDAVAGLMAAERATGAAVRVLYGGVVVGFGLAPKTLEPAPPENVEEGVAAVCRARERSAAEAPSVVSLVTRCGEVYEQEQQLGDALLLGGAGMPLPSDLDVPTRDAAELIRLKGAAGTERKRLRQELAPTFAAVQERVDAAVSLACHPDVRALLADDASTLENYRVIAATLQVLEQHWAHLADLDNNIRHLYMLAGGAEKYSGYEDFQEEANRLVKETHGVLRRLGRRLSGVAYPFEHARGPVSAADYAIPANPPLTFQIVGDALGALKRLHSLYQRCWGDLALLVEQIEASVGLPEMDLQVASGLARESDDTG
jgi:Zn-dependent protease with chaperone function